MADEEIHHKTSLLVIKQWNKTAAKFAFVEQKLINSEIEEMVPRILSEIFN